MRWTINGQPAAFATRGECLWKAAVVQSMPQPPPGAHFQGLIVDLRLRQGETLKDVHNLCERLFSVVVNQVGWFSGRRSTIRSWRATRHVDAASGCTVEVADSGVPRFT